VTNLDDILAISNRRRAEVEALRARVTWLETGLERKTQELQTAMAEVEKLRHAWADSEAACLIQVKMVRAENERLRAELRTCQETLTACLEVE